MKRPSLLPSAIITLSFVISFLFFGCEDSCETTHYYIDFEPQYITLPQARQGVEYVEPEVISTPGKIYLYNNYLLVNEIGKGIHIINNIDKTNPTQVGFINIPGNFDMAVKGDILYADNYVDLLAFDISDLSDIKEVKRLESVFNDIYWFEYLDGQEVIIAEWLEVEKSYVDDSDCRDILPDFLRGGGGVGFGGMAESADVTMAAPNSTPMGQTTGIGGSMARFTIVDEILYTVGDYKLHIFDIKVVENPNYMSNIDIEWGIETIFPFKENLFIGARNGMHIFNITNPLSPQYISTFAHVTVCDPVVANDTVAFVTLRSGTACGGFTDQLDVLDIKNLYNPKLIKTYPMLNPHGLGIDEEALFICEGEYGWKLFEVTDLNTIDQSLVNHFTGLHSYDVIPYNDVLILIGEDGLYQYDYSDLHQVKHLSTVPIVREE